MTKPRKINKRSVVINGHKTSVILDDRTFSTLKHIAATQKTTFFKLASEIELGMKPGSNFSEALRLHAVEWSLGNVKTDGGTFLRKLLKDSGGTADGFLLQTMNWALNKAGIVVEVQRGAI